MAKPNPAPQVALRLAGTLAERLERATAPFAQPNMPMTHTDRVRLALENGIALLQAAADLADRDGITPSAAVVRILGTAKPSTSAPVRKGRGRTCAERGGGTSGA